MIKLLQATLLFTILILPAFTLAHAETKIPQTLEQKVQYLMDREEIEQQIINYALSFDRKDWDLHRSVFTDDIEMDFSASIGDGLTPMKADDWVAAVKPFFENLEATQHIGIPLSIQINDDKAYVISSLRAKHYLPNERGGSTQTMFGYYENWLIRTTDGWKINRIVQHIDWNEGNWYVFEKAAGLKE